MTRADMVEKGLGHSQESDEPVLNHRVAHVGCLLSLLSFDLYVACADQPGCLSALF
jgi:hypothetical protein